MTILDGSQGEGGGQILRTSLALSLLTGKPFCIKSIRGKRKKPGLMRQHLTAVNGAKEIGKAQVSGNVMRSLELEFAPSAVTPGKYHFAVGTAGSATLVLQTILPALITASGESHLTLEGGTHNPWSPTFDYLARVVLPLLNRMGPQVSAEIKQYGFYPVGGGRFDIHIKPAPQLARLDLLERGELLKYRAEALVSKIPASIGERELKVLMEKLPLEEKDVEVLELSSPGPGNVLQLEVISDQLSELFIGFGEKGVRAERVANRTVNQVQEYIAAAVPVGRYLADQLILPMAIAGGGSFTTLEPSRHTLTNIEVVKQFLGIDVLVEQVGEKVWKVEII